MLGVVERPMRTGKKLERKVSESMEFLNGVFKMKFLNGILNGILRECLRR